MFYILLQTANANHSWIDKYANLNTFIGLVIGIVGLILTIYFYKKQKRSTNKKDRGVLPEFDEPYLGVSIKIDHVLRKFVSYGASEGEIIHAGNFKANYKVEAELNVTIQNESPYTVYELDVTYTPNQYSSNYTLRDTRENKLQPLGANKHVDYTLRITNHYNDVYASDVDMDIQKLYKIGKDTSLLNGSKLNIKYRDSKHKTHQKTEVLV